MLREYASCRLICLIPGQRKHGNLMSGLSGGGKSFAPSFIEIWSWSSVPVTFHLFSVLWLCDKTDMIFFFRAHRLYVQQQLLRQFGVQRRGHPSPSRWVFESVKKEKAKRNQSLCKGGLQNKYNKVFISVEKLLRQKLDRHWRFKLVLMSAPFMLS